MREKRKKRKKAERLIVLVGGPCCGRPNVMVADDLDEVFFDSSNGRHYVYRKHHVSAENVDCFLIDEVIVGPNEGKSSDDCNK
jgi:hypothetical protein